MQSTSELDLFFYGIKHQYKLTPTETNVLKILITNGENNRELAERFYVSETTIKNHIASIYRKTKLKSARELQAFIFRAALQHTTLSVNRDAI